MKSALLISALSAVVLAGCGFNQVKPDGSGTIECTQVQVAPQVGGRILSLPPQEGMMLKKGDLVAQLDPTDYALKRDEARGALAQAQAQLELMVAGSRDEDIQRARAQVAEAKAAATAAEADKGRIEQVFARKSATQKQLDDAKSQADRTAAALAGAEQNLARLLTGNRKEEIRMAQALVDQAKARLAQMEKAIADCTVCAPMDGVVTTRSRENGEMVATGTTLITLSRLDEVWLSIYVPEDRLGRIKLGQPGRVKIDGDKKFYEGTVTFISPEAEFTPKNVQTPDERAKLVYRSKITLRNAEGVFKPGMPADGFLGPTTKP
jgi:HlyD family secretion protein